MYDVLKGLRVLEVAEWTFVPMAASILADWGADVIKVEHPERQDPQRWLINTLNAAAPINPMFEIANRGKRSIGIDLGTEQGRALLDELIDGSDVFLTSFQADTRRRLRIEPEDIRARKPDIIYGRGTGYGLHGPDADMGGYDWASTWCRAGIADRMTAPDGEPPMMPGSVGDLTGGATLAGAIAAALVRRERTGEGAIVDNSLLSVGAYLMCQGLTAAGYGIVPPYATRANPLNPLVNTYRTSDGRWICLCMLQADRWWPDLCRRLDRTDLLDDPRFADQTTRNSNAKECIAELEATFAKGSLEYWKQALQGAEGVWAPLQTLPEVLVDPQATANGFVVPVDLPDGSTYTGVAYPGQFDEQPVGDLKASPDAGAQTEEILMELGYDWDQIIGFKEVGAVQ